MALIEIILPPMGEGITDATIVNWLKKEGDNVSEDETILEIATDKVDSEIPAPSDGKLLKILFDEGETVDIGTTIAVISTAEETELPEHINIEKIEIPSNEIQKEKLQQFQNDNSLTKSDTDIFLSPLVKNIITKENISVEELKNISGSGSNGRITKDDILNYLNNREKGFNIVKEKEKVGDKFIENNYVSEDVEVIQMGRMEKLIAQHMVSSKRISPHVTSFIEADVTNMVIWRKNNKEKFLEQYGEKLTYTPLFIEAVIEALKEFPMINISVDGDKIIKKKFINIGLAVALPDNNLIVPVIKKACQQNLTGLVKSVNDLSSRARENRLKPDEIQGGTFSVTNLGTFDNLAGTPIIHQPQSAILGIGAIVKRPVVIENVTGDTIAIRSIVILSLSFDHRAINGAYGGLFLKKIKENLENFNLQRKF